MGENASFWSRLSRRRDRHRVKCLDQRIKSTAFYRGFVSLGGLHARRGVLLPMGMGR
jgi:hypothetical protein